MEINNRYFDIAQKRINKSVEDLFSRKDSNEKNRMQEAGGIAAFYLTVRCVKKLKN